MNENVSENYNIIIAKKVEKLVTAVYLVSDLISNEDPIKRTLRLNSIELLSSINSIAQLDTKDKITEFKISLRLTTEILALLQVAKTTGIVSLMNADILMGGFRFLQTTLEKKQPVLSEEMIAVENEKNMEIGPSISISSTSYDAITSLRVASQNQLKMMSLTSKKTDTEKRHTVIKDINKGQNFKNPAKESPLASSFQVKKNNRKEQILGLFVRGVDLSIKDISMRIKGCSEKTIQRELNSLLYDNLIRRIGEKRWSRYVLR